MKYSFSSFFLCFWCVLAVILLFIFDSYVLFRRDYICKRSTTCFMSSLSVNRKRKVQQIEEGSDVEDHIYLIPSSQKRRRKLNIISDENSSDSECDTNVINTHLLCNNITTTEEHLTSKSNARLNDGKGKSEVVINARNTAKNASVHYFRSIEEEADLLDSQTEQQEIHSSVIQNGEHERINSLLRTVNHSSSINDRNRICQSLDCMCDDMDETYFKYFGINVCRVCRWKPEFKCITKTNAKKDYLLSEGDIQVLKYWLKSINNIGNGNIGQCSNQSNFVYTGEILCRNYENDNNNNRKYSSYIPKSMKLYLEYQVKQLSYSKWGGNDGIIKERQKRAVRKMQRSIFSLRKKREPKCMDDVSICKSVAKEFRNRKHVHTFTEAIFDEENNEWSKECTSKTCNFIETWEEF